MSSFMVLYISCISHAVEPAKHRRLSLELTSYNVSGELPNEVRYLPWLLTFISFVWVDCHYLHKIMK